MTDLLAIIQNGNGNIKLEVTGEDLLMFSNQLISRAKYELSTAWKIQCKMPPKTKRFYPLVPK